MMALAILYDYACISRSYVCMCLSIEILVHVKFMFI
jgi:hypothetical protein